MKSIFTLFLVSAALFVSSQQNTFKVRVLTSGFSFSALYQLVQLSDGSFVSVGNADPSPDVNQFSIYLLKTDAAGNVLASKSVVSTDGNDDGYSVAKTSDGGFILSASSASGDVELLKFGADLSIAWQKRYTIPGEVVTGNTGTVIQTTDGGYMVPNSINLYTEDSTEPAGAALIKTDAQGNVQFVKKYFNKPDKLIDDIAATADGNYVLLCGSFLDEEDSSYLIKINPQGNILWSRAVFSESAQPLTYLLSLAATSDGSILLAGVSNDDGNRTGDNKMLMMKYSGAGVLQWSKKVASGRNTSCGAGAVTEDKDGNYVFAGGLGLYRGRGDTAYSYAVKTDKNGALLWTKAFDRNTEDGDADVQDIITTSDGGYAVCGEGDFYNADSGRYQAGSFLYKLDATVQPCNEIAVQSGSLENGAKEDTTRIFTEDLSATASDAGITLTDVGTVDKVCSSDALPVQLLSFGAVLQSKRVSINWTTANEVNTDYFVVERSADKRSFDALQKVAAKGNSSITQSYSTNDLQPLPGTSYYRLKEVDKDGKTTYSSVVPVTVMSNGTIVISPNPVQNNIRVIVQSINNNNLTLQVVDIKGNVLAAQTKAVVAGRNEINIAASSLAKGVYVLKVTDSKTTQAIRFVKE